MPSPCQRFNADATALAVQQRCVELQHADCGSSGIHRVDRREWNCGNGLGWVDRDQTQLQIGCLCYRNLSVECHLNCLRCLPVVMLFEIWNSPSVNTSG